jgi:hypothetical protein
MTGDVDCRGSVTRANHPPRQIYPSSRTGTAQSLATVKAVIKGWTGRSGEGLRFEVVELGLGDGSGVEQVLRTSHLVGRRG